ncbi:hypothetical protein [Streptomyces abikoensis]|uniref:Uncharacterized protein n=1 Tax=Streptomyces abikoensis TaxID=97398 RepID=A0ABW7T9G7_9ACTN
MAEVKGNVRLRRLRADRNRTQEEIVADLTERADRMFSAGKLSKRVSFSVRQYSKWEGNDPPLPHPTARRVLEELFGCPITDMGFAAVPGAHEPVDERALSGPDRDPSTNPRTERAAPGFPGADSVPWLTSPSAGPTAQWRISEAEVDLLRAAADDMDAIDQQFGGNRLWRPTRAHLLWVHRMIDLGIYNEQLGRQLHTVAGKFTTSLGWFCYDAGLQTEARYYFSEALNTANFTGDDALASRTLSNMARQAVDLQKGREAIRFARLAQAHAGEWAAPHRVAALLAIREAQGHAQLGDRRACETSIRNAWTRWERGSSDRDPDWSVFLNEAELTCLEGMCWLDLGQYGRAQRLLARSEALQDIAHSRNRGMCLGRLAVASLENRDVEHSVNAARQSLRLIEGGMASTRAVEQLKIVREGLVPHRRSRAVGDLLEEIRPHIA